MIRYLGKNILPTFLFVFLSGQFAFALPLTEANWMSHPKIKEVRQLVSDVDKKIKSGEFRVDTRTFCPDVPGWPELKLASDETGKARMYYWLNCGEDSCNKETRYYDKNGNVRFVHFTRKAIHNFMAGEARVYFDENGDIIWEKIGTAVFDDIYKPPVREGLKSDPVQDFKDLVKDNEEVGNREIPRGKAQRKFCN